MALKGKRSLLADAKCKAAAAVEAGKILIYDTNTSPAATGAGDNAALTNVKVYAGAPIAGMKFFGVAIDDVVVADTALIPRQSYGYTTRFAGEPFLAGTHGWVMTDQVVGTPAAGDVAYLGADSKFTATQVASLPPVGVFETAKDTDGFAKVSFLKRGA